MGNLIHAGENYHRVVEIVRSGVLGTISKTRVWMAADRSGLGNPPDGDPRLAATTTSGSAPLRSALQPEPVHLQLALVLGLRRRNADGLLLPHCRPGPLVDGSRRARTVIASGGRFALHDNAETPDTLEVAYHYAKGRNFVMVWSHTDANTHGFENKGLGIMFQGTDATLVADYGSHKIFPEKGRTIHEPR